MVQPAQSVAGLLFSADAAVLSSSAPRARAWRAEKEWGIQMIQTRQNKTPRIVPVMHDATAAASPCNRGPKV
jgi:hypothetical protein